MGQDDQQQSGAGGARARSVLGRMARAGQEERNARIVTLPKALRITVAKVADDLLDMAMAVIGVRVEDRDGEGLAPAFDPAHLLMLLDGPRRRRGAITFDPVLVGGLIQQQTMGKVLAARDGDTRRLTETDAAICAPFVDALLARAVPLVEDLRARGLMEGFAFGARVSDPRLMLMALDAPAYKVVHLTIDMAGGARQGQVMLCLPDLAETEIPTAPDIEGDGAEGPARTEPPLARTVLGLNVALKVALTRLRMPVKALQAIRVGDVIDLKTTAFDQCRVETDQGRVLSRGTLGQINGMRALQLEHAPAALREPRRRKSDRGELDLPQVEGDGTGTRVAPVKAARAGADADPGMPAGLSTLDASDTDAGLPDLASLPDMSDLPGFDDEMADLPKLGVG